MKVQDVLLGNKANKNQGQQTVEEARAAMIAAGELPTGLARERKKNEAVAPAPNQVIATPTVVRSAASQRNEQALAISGPTEIVAVLTYVDGQAEEIVVDTKEALVAVVDAKSAQLREAGQPTRIHVSYALRPKADVSEQFVTEATSTQPARASKNGAVEQEETKDFIATIKQDGGQWVGELVYKNGAGTERFVAASKNALSMKMLVGKGNASIKIRRVVREQQYGVELDKSYKFPHMTQEEYDNMPPAAQQEIIDAAALKSAIAFRQEHPEYLNTTENWDKIKRFLDKRELVYTYSNLEYAYDQLTENEELSVKVTEPTVTHVIPRVEDSAAVAVPTSVAPAPVTVLRKRGTTGLVPGTFSSSTELDTTEESAKPRELSDAELKALPLSEHKKLYRASLKTPNRQF